MNILSRYWPVLWIADIWTLNVCTTSFWIFHHIILCNVSCEIIQEILIQYLAVSVLTILINMFDISTLFEFSDVSQT